MKSIKNFEGKKLENSNFINGGSADTPTTYTLSNGSSGTDTICDNDGNGVDPGDTVVFNPN